MKAGKVGFVGHEEFHIDTCVEKRINNHRFLGRSINQSMTKLARIRWTTCWHWVFRWTRWVIDPFPCETFFRWSLHSSFPNWFPHKTLGVMMNCRPRPSGWIHSQVQTVHNRIFRFPGPEAMTSAPPPPLQQCVLRLIPMSFLRVGQSWI